jgi:hypothetical protein
LCHWLFWSCNSFYSNVRRGSTRGGLGSINKKATTPTQQTTLVLSVGSVFAKIPCMRSSTLSTYVSLSIVCDSKPPQNPRAQSPYTNNKNTTRNQSGQQPPPQHKHTWCGAWFGWLLVGFLVLGWGGFGHGKLRGGRWIQTQKSCHARRSQNGHKQQTKPNNTTHPRQNTHEHTPLCV